MRGKLLQMVQDHAQAVVRDCMARNNICDDATFRLGKVSRSVRARSQAIKQLHEDGFNQRLIALVLSLDPKTVAFRFNLDSKRRHNIARKALYERKRAAEMRASA